MEVYKQHKHYDVPDTQIFRKYIYPVFFISKRTFQTILGTNINKELAKFENGSLSYGKNQIKRNVDGQICA